MKSGYLHCGGETRPADSASSLSALSLSGITLQGRWPLSPRVFFYEPIKPYQNC